MIRPFDHADADAVLDLNATNVPEVGPMDRAKLELLVADALLLEVAEVDGDIVGALVVLEEGSSYGSPNYAWFSKRHPSFAYVDRVMLAPGARGRGFGIEFYDHAGAAARAAGKPVLCAEVNTIPPNPRSLRFHEVYGFEQIELQRPYGEDEEVAMLELVLR